MILVFDLRILGFGFGFGFGFFLCVCVCGFELAILDHRSEDFLLVCLGFLCL